MWSEWILTALRVILQGIGALIPDVPVPFSDELETAGDVVGTALGGLNGFIPIEEFGTAVGWGLAFYVPFVIGYTIFRWVWGHVPYVGGGQ